MKEILPTTTTQLLDGLKDAKSQVWPEFVHRYEPILCRFTARLGLGKDDSQDVTQQTLTEFFREFSSGTYKRERGRLRSWLFTIARNRSIDVLRGRQRRNERQSTEALERVPSEEESSQLWIEEQSRVIGEAAIAEYLADENVKSEVRRAFELFAMLGMPAEAVAAECGISTQQVYSAKNRGIARVKVIVERMSGAYEQDE